MPKNLDLKISIARSHSRKINLGNFESADFFSSRSIELPADTPAEEVKKWSDKIFEDCVMDVDMDAIRYRSKLLKGEGGFDPVVKKKPVPWNQYKVPEKYQKKSRLPVKSQEEDWDQVPPDDQLEIINEE